MNEYTQHHDNSALITALHQHLEHAYLALAQAFQPVVQHHDPHSIWFFTTHPVPLCNGVIHTECSVTEIDQLIKRIIHDAQARQVPLLWLVGPSTQPEDLSQRLEMYGLINDESVAGMILDPQALPEDQSQHPRLTVSPVQTHEQMESWLQAFTTGFGLPEPLKQVLFSLYRTYGFVPDASRQFYLGTIDTTPVATSLVFMDGHVAGIYAVATVPTHRQQGIGTKMTRVALEEARRLGYTHVTLQATPMGQSIYRRLGFREVCSFQTYLWMPAGDYKSQSN